MTSKYDTYWQTQLDAILALFNQARTAGTSSQMALTGLDALGKRDSWYGKLEIVGGQHVYGNAAHVQSLGEMLTARLPNWAREPAWTVTIGKDSTLTVQQLDSRRTNWFEDAYRTAKQKETFDRAGRVLGPLQQDPQMPSTGRTESGVPVYAIFATRKDGWLAPRRSRLEAAAAEKGQVIISITDEEAGLFSLWIIPAVELVAAIQNSGLSASLDSGDAFSFNLQTDQAADLVRQLNWDIRPYRRESGRTDVTRATFWPADKPRVLAKPFDEMFANREEAEWAFALLGEAAQRLGLRGPDDPMGAWTLRRRAGQYHLHFSYGQWLVLGLAGASGHLTLKLALFRDRIDLPYTAVESFTQKEGETPVSLHYVEPKAWRSLEDSVQEVYGETLDYLKKLFTGWLASPYHKYTDPPVAQAVFDAGACARLLGRGMNAPVQRFWKIAPGDDAWHWAACHDGGFIAIGWDELGDLSSLDRAGFEAHRTEVQQKHPDWSNEALEQVWKFAQIQEDDRIVANRGTSEVLGIGTVTGPYYFVPDERHGHRLPVKWDDSTRRQVKEGGWRRSLVELDERKFNALASAPPITGTGGTTEEDTSSDDGDTETAHVQSAFSPRAFQLLKGIHAEPTKAYYQTHKEEFKAEVEEPFQRLMAQTAEKLPPQVRGLMETEQRVFSRFLKNDWGKGGTWDFYWGAFYPKGGKRTSDAQLSLWMNYQRLEYGFYIGDYGSAQRQRFQRNCETHFEALKELLGDMLTDEALVYGPGKDFTFGAEDELLAMPGTTWQEFLRDPERANNDVSVVMPRADVLATPAVELVDRIAGTYKQLLPLVLLAVYDQPLVEIANYLDAIAPEDDSETPPIVQPSYPLAQCAAETGLPEAELAGWVRAIERKGQAILYGPPGTGKTFVAERLARHLIGGGDGFWDLVQFHPAYAYEDFIQGIRPKTTDGGGLSYPTIPGRFLEFCEKAKGHDRCVLIIDEINRANLARVFGELMYLLEYRDQKVPLAGGGTLRIPENVRVIGTMNTADRSIALVDHALRRRFAFLALYPNYDVLRDFHRRENTSYPVEKLIQVLTRLNSAIHDRHYHVGITFFLRKALAAEIADIWRMEIEPYLDEYFFDQPDKADAFRWERVQADLLP